jgi:IclR family pca regulon transcriptional regulator
MPKKPTTNDGTKGDNDAARSIPTLREPRYSQSLERGLAVLRSFTREHRVLGISELADELGMSRSTTHRYVLTLSALGYLEQQTSRKYRLSHRAADVGMSALRSNELYECARRCLEQLHKRTSCTSIVAVLDGSEIVCIGRVSASHCEKRKPSLAPGVGSRLPVHCTAMGKLLLAYAPEPKRRIIMSETNLTKHGPNAITSKRQLRQELEEISASGLAISDSEFAAELCAMAAPVPDQARNVIAAISIAEYGSITALRKLKPHLVAAADGLSGRLGQRRDHE